MIQNGSLVVLKTASAIYSPCTIVSMGGSNKVEKSSSITITFFAGMKRDQKGKLYADHRTETIPNKEIVSISERT